MGVLAAIYERQNFGRGQVIDAAIVAGTASLMLVFSMLAGARMGKAARGQNMLDGSVHFYRVDECADGKYVSLGAIEPQFYAVFRELLGEDAPESPHMKVRGVYQEAFGIVQAAPAPRFSRMQGAIQGGPPLQFAPWDDVHADWRSCAKHHEDA
jgi:alpha-methylacyl-CoA racemase